MPSPRKPASKSSSSRPPARSPSNKSKIKTDAETTKHPLPAAAAGKRQVNRDGVETGETHQRFPTTSLSNPKENKAFAIDAARMLSDDKCDDIVILDVSGMSQISDFIIIASGTSDRQMRSSGDDIEKLGAGRNMPIFRKGVDDRATWIVLDFVDVVAHIFEPNTRAHYDLEMLWADAPRLDWERTGNAKRDRAGLK